ncbi:hypothetical protein SASPL_104696 [Salvia splendens]|uniref:DUF7803 domain-containing protein n=1 Tax=Salvia splendens TaxID=180675 RepID=A0A8X8YKD7_SALSN|nr:hypothetical protein SASPL_104696 [Salvia splendens]
MCRSKMAIRASDPARSPKLGSKTPRRVDSKPGMEETILVGDDLMMGPPSPVIPSEIASHVLEGVDLCDGILRNLFLCLQINDIEPFCQDEIAIYKQCAERRDKELRQRLQDSERKLGMFMPLNLANERSTQLEAEATQLERLDFENIGILHWLAFADPLDLALISLSITSIFTKRLEALKLGIESRKEDETVGESSTKKKWFFW